MTVIGYRSERPVQGPPSTLSFERSTSCLGDEGAPAARTRQLVELTNEIVVEDDVDPHVPRLAHASTHTASAREPTKTTAMEIRAELSR
jgi:hypothetical protein